jgi:hypothetical protein
MLTRHACRHYSAPTVQRKHCRPLAWHCYSANDSTAWCHTATKCSMAGDKISHVHTVKDIICYS